MSYYNGEGGEKSDNIKEDRWARGKILRLALRMLGGGLQPGLRHRVIQNRALHRAEYLSTCPIMGGQIDDKGWFR